MKTRIFALVITALLVALTVSACDLGKETPVTSEKGKFSVTFPAGFSAPKMETQPMSTQLGKIDMTTYSTENSRGACVVAFYDYPEEVFKQKETKDILTDSGNGSIKALSGKLEKQEEITVDGNPGLSVRFSGTSGGHELYARYDYIIAKPRVYQVAFVGTNKAELDKEGIQNYFKSFKVTGK